MVNLTITPRYKVEERRSIRGRQETVIVDQFSTGVGGSLQVVAIPYTEDKYTDLLLNALNAQEVNEKMEQEKARRA
jgi:hypothetical protein